MGGRCWSEGGCVRVPRRGVGVLVSSSEYRGGACSGACSGEGMPVLGGSKGEKGELEEEEEEEEEEEDEDDKR